MHLRGVSYMRGVILSTCAVGCRVLYTHVLMSVVNRRINPEKTLTSRIFDIPVDIVHIHLSLI